MGSGKTTVGRDLAERLSCSYLDNDTLLLTSAGATAETLAAAVGAHALHEHESQQIRELVQTPGPFVASIAASVGDRPTDLSLLSTAGYVVYLRARPDTIAQRVGAGEGRPWLRDDPGTVIQRMFDGRDSAYRACATVVVDCDDLEPASIVEALVPMLRATG
jgi:shikimate kinase